MQLAMNIFNASNSKIIFALKLICLCGGIVGMYFFIRLAPTEPFVVTFIFLILINNGTVFYAVMWNNVSVIPDTMEEIRRGINLQSQTQAGRQEARKIARSIASVSVRVGNFREIERNSALLYLDFVVSNAINLLIGF